MPRTSSWVCLAALVIASSACSESEKSASRPDGSSSQSDATPDSPSNPNLDADRLDATASGCPPGSGDPRPEASCIEAISGRFVDDAGEPAPSEMLVTACGQAQCDPGYTDADGRFRIQVNVHLIPSEYSVLAHARPDRAAFYFQLPEDAAPTIDMGDLRLLSMPADGPLIEVDRMGAPAQALTSGEVTLSIPEATFVRLDVESATFGEEGRRFRAIRVPAAMQDELVDASVGALAVYGFEPFEAQFEVPVEKTLVDVRLTFENTLGLMAGERIEVLALGSYLFPEWVRPAEFEPVATGFVTSDGERIELDPGEGITYLTWVAIRPM